MEKLKSLRINKESSSYRIKALVGAAAAALQLRFQGSAEIGVTIVDDDQVRQINKEHRNIDSTTDVLSFPMERTGSMIKPETGLHTRRYCLVNRARDGAGGQVRDRCSAKSGISLYILFFTFLDTTMLTGGLEAVRMREREEAIISVGFRAGAVMYWLTRIINLESVDKSFICRAQDLVCIRHERISGFILSRRFTSCGSGSGSRLAVRNGQSCC